MKILELMEKLGKTKTDLAKDAGISIQQLCNMIGSGVEVEELKDGRYVTVRRDAVCFNGKVNHETQKN